MNKIHSASLVRAVQDRRIGGVEDAFLRFLGVDDPQARRDMVEQILLEEMRTARADRRRCTPMPGNAGAGPQVLVLSRDPETSGLVVAVPAPSRGRRSDP